MLAQNGLHAFFEPFMFRERGHDHFFFHWVKDRAVSAFDLIASPHDVLADYLRYLSERSATSRFAVDVKYNQMYLFDGRVRQPNQCPGLLRYFHEHKRDVVHLVRRNVVAQYLSNEMLRATKVSFVTPGDKPLVAGGARAQPEAGPMTLDPARCLQTMRAATLATNLFRSWNTGNRRYRELFYEDLFADGVVTDAGAAEIGAVFGIEVARREPEFVKLSYDYRAIVTNRDDLVRGLKGTPYFADAEAMLG